MEFSLQSTNSNDYETFLLHHTWLNEVCKDGCEMEEDVAWAKFIIELVLIPTVGSIGILGNSVSIFVLCKSSQKTTFQHVRDWCLFKTILASLGHLYRRSDKGKKYSRQMSDAWTLQWTVKRWGDVLQLFWMGDFGDNPQKLGKIWVFEEYLQNLPSKKVVAHLPIFLLVIEGSLYLPFVWNIFFLLSLLL